MLDNIGNIVSAVLWFAVISGILGIILAVASKAFEVKVDERVTQICEILPGANCGGCGYAGCSALAEAIVKGEAPTNACVALGDEGSNKICAVMGVEATGSAERFRAQVMCSGTPDLAKRKYIYEGVMDCIAASHLAGGDRLCPNGCVGLGTCVSACKFDAIKVVDGVAVVDSKKCVACGVCVNSCPKHLIKLVPFESKHWVGCMSHDKGNITRTYCDVGCIGCKLCEKKCPEGAIKVTDSVAEIDYSLCTGCDKCVEACPRHIIWSAEKQEKGGLVIKREIFEKPKPVVKPEEPAAVGAQEQKDTPENV